MTMTRERMTALLTNPTFVNAMTELRRIRDARHGLQAAKATLQENHITAQNTLGEKIRECAEAEKRYHELLEDLFHVSWHWHRRVYSCLDDEIEPEKLPEIIQPI